MSATPRAQPGWTRRFAVGCELRHICLEMTQSSLPLGHWGDSAGRPMVVFAGLVGFLLGLLSLYADL